MARDYKHQANPRGATGPAIPGWVWLIAGFAFGFATAAGIGLTKAPVVTPQDVAETRPAPQKRSPDTPDDSPADNKTRFDFYKMLPNFEVVIPEQDKEVTPSGQVGTVEQPGAYVLQAGSFRNAADADRLKAELALLGVESRVQEVTIDDTQTWHRVRVGPISDLERLNTIRGRLRENGIPALVIRVGE